MDDNEKAAVGSGNAFQDLGRPDAAEQQAKVKLAIAINEAIVERSLRRCDAATLFGCVRPEVSAIANPRLVGFSIGRLMEFPTSLDRDVEIGIRKRRGPGSVLVRDMETA